MDRRPPDAWYWIDVTTEFVITGGVALIGYMSAAEALSMPSGAGWLAASIGGLIGAGNHIRALRKQP